MRRFGQKSALITGGAAGIGLAAARRFVHDGGRVTLVDINENALREAAESLGAAATYFVADVSDPKGTQECIAHAISRHQEIDVAVLNAGVEGPIATIDETPLDIFERIMAVNVRGTWLGLASLLPLMRAQ